MNDTWNFDKYTDAFLVLLINTEERTKQICSQMINSNVS